jgi:glucose-1-phosphate adenylyltransferase
VIEALARQWQAINVDHPFRRSGLPLGWDPWHAEAQTPKVLAIVLAGGEGKRLMPLTRDRAKPAVPFGGIYRLIDFALSNVVNSGYLKVVVLTQYKSHSLDRTSPRPGACRRCSATTSPHPRPSSDGQELVPRQRRRDLPEPQPIDDEKPDIVVVVGADHVYRMDFSQMVEQHIETGAGVTVAAIRQPISWPTSSASSRSTPTGPARSRPSARSRPTPRASPTAPDESSPPWATTSSRRRLVDA